MVGTAVGFTVDDGAAVGLELGDEETGKVGTNVGVELGVELG